MMRGVINPTSEMGGGRVPQWGQQETRELIAIRGEMERGEMGKRGNASSNNKTMWEEVAGRMREKGYTRTGDQCKCKWKNLVNRYKGKETTDPDNTKQCPFFDELHAVFNERARTMHRKLLESESTSTKKKPKRRRDDDASDDVEEDDDDDPDDDVSEEETKPVQNKKTKPRVGTTASTSGRSSGGIQELLQGFLQQQQAMENQWREVMERRVQERMMFEQGWRESMERLERERLMLEQSWMDREEQRRIREETRAEKRDQLLTTLLNKLLQDEL